MSSPGDGPSSDDGDVASGGGPATDEGPRRRRRADGGGSEPSRDETGPLGYLRRFRDSDNEAVVFVREVLSSAAMVAVIGLLLFAISGVWPPMVAIESGSMEPHMEKGDLVFIMDEGRFAPDAAHGDTGVVTYRAGQEAGYTKFDSYGDVIIYEPYGDQQTTPIIHRARFWVEDGENWYDEADKDHITSGIDSCEELANCPAPHAGFITKGDANTYYDQVDGMGVISDPVRPAWIRGTAEVRIPWLGWVRLQFSGAA